VVGLEIKRRRSRRLQLELKYRKTFTYTGKEQTFKVPAGAVPGRAAVQN